MSRALAVAAMMAGWIGLANGDTAPIDEARVAEHSAQYKEFLTRGPTAFTAIGVARQWAGAAGFREVDLDADGACDGFAPGDALTFVWHDRSALFVRIGTEPISAGMAMVGAHADAPALRVTPEPIGSGSGDMVTLEVTAYGGIKPFHYRDRVLQLIGRVARSDGTTLDIALGPDQGYSFVVSSLDPSENRDDRGIVDDRDGHRRMSLVVSASRDTLVATLKDSFGISTQDLRAAELFAVPAEPARDVGLDRALVGGYGQDDRALSYAALRAIIELSAPTHTAAAYLVDREETGSRGRTGAQAPQLEQAIACIARAAGTTEAKLDAVTRDALAASVALSSDVKSAINPNWDEVQQDSNAPVMGDGPTLVKFTGHSGKRGASDAHAELHRHLTEIATTNKIPFQRSETGRVDEGGGGTIAIYLAEREIDVIDVGIPMLSMHAPLELTSKRDMTARVPAGRGARSQRRHGDHLRWRAVEPLPGDRAGRHPIGHAVRIAAAHRRPGQPASRTRQHLARSLGGRTDRVDLAPRVRATRRATGARSGANSR